jgi:hypothetical protein
MVVVSVRDSAASVAHVNISTAWHVATDPAIWHDAGVYHDTGTDALFFTCQTRWAIRRRVACVCAGGSQIGWSPIPPCVSRRRSPSYRYASPSQDFIDIDDEPMTKRR